MEINNGLKKKPDEHRVLFRHTHSKKWRKQFSKARHFTQINKAVDGPSWRLAEGSNRAKRFGATNTQRVTLETRKELFLDCKHHKNPNIEKIFSFWCQTKSHIDEKPQKALQKCTTKLLFPEPKIFRKWKGYPLTEWMFQVGKSRTVPIKQ